MNPKKITIAVAIAFVIALVWRANVKQPLQQDRVGSDAATRSAAATVSSQSAGTGLMRGSRAKLPAHQSSVTNLGALIENYRAQMKNDPLYQFKVPMEFHGIVLDESEKPVPDANIHFAWNNLNETNGLDWKVIDTKSDAQGLFSLSGERGGRLEVTVGKEGYYTSKQNPLAFEFATPGDGAYYTPDSQNPVIFHIRKKGQGVPLITSKNGMRTDVRVHIPFDGKPITIDLLHQQAASNGQLQVSQSKPAEASWRDATHWSFRMTIPDGGLVETDEEYPFQAPDQGYQQTIDLDFQKGTTNWAEGIKKTYYIRFGTPPTYGTLHVETTITDSAAQFRYMLNPDGSQNLEPAN